jgi:hypothetical protein
MHLFYFISELQDMEIYLAVGGVVILFLLLLCFLYWYNKPSEEQQQQQQQKQEHQQQEQEQEQQEHQQQRQQQQQQDHRPMSGDSGRVTPNSTGSESSFSSIQEQSRSLTGWVNVENPVAASHYSSIESEVPL